MVNFRSTSAFATAASALSASASAVRRQQSPAFDGQYLNPIDTDLQLEWWLGQVIAPADAPEGTPLSLQFIFYMGFPIAVSPANETGLPEYHLVINGYFPNGTDFTYDAVAATSATVTQQGDAVSGVWEGVGSFALAEDYSTWKINFDGSEVQGTVTLYAGDEHHYNCNTTDTPYFTPALPEGTSNLSKTEDLLFNKLGWPTTFPGGKGDVDITVHDVPLKFSGVGTHDANWLPVPLNEAVTTWYLGTGEVGPYEFSYALATPINSSMVLDTGYLSKNGVKLQSQCSVVGAKSNDYSKATPYGSYTDEFGLTMPEGFILEYLLSDGSHYEFNLTAKADNAHQQIYHRWTGSAVGGADGESIEGVGLFEWLNPGNVVYTPSP